MLLSELLATPGLGLRLLHAPPGSLERPVGRTITIDLLEPGRFLTGGELVLTGLVWRRTPEDSETFVTSIASRGAASLLAGAAQLGSVPDDLVEACRRHELALVEVPVDVPFADITEHVAAAGAAGVGARLSASLVRQRQLLSAVAEGRSLDELAARVSAEVGHACRVLTASGRHVVPGPGELDPDTVDLLTRAFLTADVVPAVAEAGGTSYSLLAVGSGLADRLTGWALVVAGDHRAWPQDVLDAIHELGAIVALDRSRREEGLRVLRPPRRWGRSRPARRPRGSARDCASPGWTRTARSWSRWPSSPAASPRWPRLRWRTSRRPSDRRSWRPRRTAGSSRSCRPGPV
ncbi:purine catabolism regulatory family protein [Nocardioides sp. J9]|nr:purine catabolism regulatory family protein [Nocardioides sp. J9]